MNFNSFDIMKKLTREEVDREEGRRRIKKDRKEEKQQMRELQLPPAAAPPQGGDGSSIEVVKRPRGRPPGSKNKPKPPLLITKEAEPSAAMRPLVLEIPGGHDVADCLAGFSRRRNLGISVLAGTGAVANVVLRQPSSPAASAPAAGSGVTIGFHGRFEVLSMSATFLPPAMAASCSASGGMSISLAGQQGQIVGGTVAGPLVAAGTVVIVAAAFTNPTFHRLPPEDDVSVSVLVSVEPITMSAAPADCQRQGKQKQQYESEQKYFHHYHQQSQSAAESTAAESCGMAIYCPPFSTEVMWPATAGRPPPPPF